MSGETVVVVNTQEEALVRRFLCVANAEIAESLRDLCFAVNLPGHEHRNTKIAGCLEGIERAVHRIENNVLKQRVTKLSTAQNVIKEKDEELAELRRELAALRAPAQPEEAEAVCATDEASTVEQPA